MKGAPAAPRRAEALRQPPLRDVIEGGRALRGYSCEVTASGHEASRLERQVCFRRAPCKVHAPGLGYFGVKLRPDAREVTKCRSPPLKPDTGLWTQFVSRSSPRRVSQRRNEMSPQVQPGPVGARLPDCRRIRADVWVLFWVRFVVGVFATNRGNVEGCWKAVEVTCPLRHASEGLWWRA